MFSNAPAVLFPDLCPQILHIPFSMHTFTHTCFQAHRLNPLKAMKKEKGQMLQEQDSHRGPTASCEACRGIQ